jgi:hypothetical protein
LVFAAATVPMLTPLLQSQAASKLSAVEAGMAHLLPDTTKATLREANDILEMLLAPPEEPSGLFTRISALLAERGDDFIMVPGGFQNIRTVVLNRLRSTQQLAAFATMNEAAAQRFLTATTETTDKRDLTRHWSETRHRYPGTQAAQQALEHLRNRAWDQGQLASFLTYADRNDPRYAAAQSLLASDSLDPLPRRLVGGFKPLWQLPKLPAYTDSQRNQQAPYRLSSNDQAIAAGTNGRHLIVFDMYQGTLLGQPLRFSHGNKQRLTMPPLINQDSIYASTSYDTGVEIVAANLHGELRWRWHEPAHNPAASAPLLLGGHVVIASQTDKDGSKRLVLSRIDRHTGTTVTSQALLRSQGSVYDNLNDPPLLAPTATGAWLLGSNGVVGRLDGTGHCQQLWRYKQQQRRSPDFRTRSAFQQRVPPPRLLGNDDWVATQPSDGVGLWFGHRDHDGLQQYTGIGADDALVALHGSLAVLVGKRITLYDLAGQAVKYSHALPQAIDNSEQLSSYHDQDLLLVADAQSLRLFDLRTGAAIDHTGHQDVQVHLLRDLLIAQSTRNADRSMLVARGPHNLADQLIARLQQEPDRPELWTRLASLYLANQKTDQAKDAYEQALLHGAGPAVAEQAADLIRRRLQLQLGSDHFPVVLKRLTDLRPHLRNLDGEIAWWQLRQAESNADRSGAEEALVRLNNAPDRLLRFDEFSVALDFIRNDVSAKRYQRAPAAQLKDLTAWRLNDLGGQDFLRSGRRLIAFRQGWLRGYDLTTGQETWQANDSNRYRPLVGFKISQRRFDQMRDFPVVEEVLPGTTATLLGLRAEDQLTHLDGQALPEGEDAGWHYFRNTIQQKKPLDAVTIGVLRHGVPVTLTGSIGTEPQHVIDASDSLIITALADTERDLQAIKVGTQGTYYVIHAETGALLAPFQTVDVVNPAQNQRRARNIPRNHISCTADWLHYFSNGQLQAWQIIDGALSKQWTANNASPPQDITATASGDWLITLENGYEIRHRHTGALLLSFNDRPMLADNFALFGGGDTPMRLINLKTTEEMWRYDEGDEPLAMNQHMVLVLNRQGKLAFRETHTGQLRVQTQLTVTQRRLLVDQDRVWLVAADGRGGTQLITMVASTGRQLNAILLPRTLNVLDTPVAAFGGAVVTLGAQGARPTAVLVHRHGGIIDARMIDRGLQQATLDQTVVWRRASQHPNQHVEQPFDHRAVTNAPKHELITWPQPMQAEALLKQHLPFQLQPCVGGSYVLGWLNDGTLRVYLELAPTQQTQAIHISLDDNQQFDINGQFVHVERGATVMVGAGGWALIAETSAQEDDGTLRSIIDLAPPPLLQPGQHLRLLIGDESQAGGPWWLLRSQGRLDPQALP